MVQNLPWQNQKRTSTKLFNKSGPLNFHFHKHYVIFYSFIDVGHCMVWDVIDLVTDIAIPFADANFCGMSIFDCPDL